MKLHYAAPLAAAALIAPLIFAVPVAFAQERDGGTPPPPPSFFMGFDRSNTHNQGMMERDEQDSEEDSTTTEHRPMMQPHPEARNASSTKPNRGWGLDRGEGRPMMESSTENKMWIEHGTSTVPHRGPTASFFAHFLNFISDKRDSGTSTPPLSPPRIEGEVTASTTSEDTSTQERRPPPQAVIQFFQNFFGRFFH